MYVHMYNIIRSRVRKNKMLRWLEHQLSSVVTSIDIAFILTVEMLQCILEYKLTKYKQYYNWNIS